MTWIRRQLIDMPPACEKCEDNLPHRRHASVGDVWQSPCCGQLWVHHKRLYEPDWQPAGWWIRWRYRKQAQLWKPQAEVPHET